MHSFANNSDRSPLQVVLATKIFTKDSFMRLKRKRLGPTINLKEVRRERGVAPRRKGRGYTSPPRREGGEKYSCPLEEEAGYAELLVRSKEDKGVVCKISNIFFFYVFLVY